jgi:hypothetical protein
MEQKAFVLMRRRDFENQFGDNNGDVITSSQSEGYLIFPGIVFDWWTEYLQVNTLDACNDTIITPLPPWPV